MLSRRESTRSASRRGRVARLLAGLLVCVATAAALGQDSFTQGSAARLERSAPGASLGGVLSQPDFLPVEEAYRLVVETDGADGLRLLWRMEPGYYLYQHAFRFRLLRGDAASVPEADYPEALVREDEYFGRVEVYYDSVEVGLAADRAVAGARLEVVSQGCADAGLCYPPRTQTFAIDADGGVREVTVAAPRRAPVSSPTPRSAGTLPFMLLLAFAGGLILNLMPCVLPILSLKVLGFALAPAAERHRHGLFYGAGVVSSFLAIAAVLIGLRGAGQAIGWGFQLQSPTVVLALAYLFVVLGLAMSGVLELGGRLMNLGSDLADAGGSRGSFFTGVLAVVVASPCTAPFMGTALGYALVQPAAIGLAVFAALGVGMALPMLLLSFSETARRRMPRPGPWMERLKQGLAFPLYATALWLFWVAGRQAGVDVMAAALFGALLLALGLWLWRGALPARIAATACFAATLLLAGWRPPLQESGGGGLPEGAVAYSPTALAELRADGRGVFVDVTADWCITCLANEQAVLETDPVQSAFRESGVVYMVADWTDYDPEIAEFVASHGRSGIPLYVLYDGRRAPQLMPQILRRGTLVDALRRVAGDDVAAAEP